MYEKILVPIDGSPTASRALTEAARLARLCDTRLRLIHIVDPVRHITGFEPPEIYAHDIVPEILKAGEALLVQAQRELEAQGLKVEMLLHECRGERVSEAIVEHAKTWEADLIVLGTHGRRGVDRILVGSTAELVTRTSPVPVLLVKLPRTAESGA